MSGGGCQCQFLSVVLFSVTHCVVRWVTDFWLLIVHAASGGGEVAHALYSNKCLRCIEEKIVSLRHTTADCWITYYTSNNKTNYHDITTISKSST